MFPLFLLLLFPLLEPYFQETKNKKGRLEMQLKPLNSRLICYTICVTVHIPPERGNSTRADREYTPAYYSLCRLVSI
jgi:hypothetical protein